MVDRMDSATSGVECFSLMPPLSSTDRALAAAIRRLRQERGETQEDVAYNAELTTGSFNLIEKGKANPTWSTVRKIARALEVPISTLAKAAERAEYAGATDADEMEAAAAPGSVAHPNNVSDGP